MAATTSPHLGEQRPPALDAAELQAMCNAIVQNQGDAAALQAALQALTTRVSGKAGIERRTYVGTGTYGPDAPTSVTFNSNPALVFVISDSFSGNFILFTKLTSIARADTANSRFETYVDLSWRGKAVSWEVSSSSLGSGAKYQLNERGKQYSAIAFY